MKKSLLLFLLILTFFVSLISKSQVNPYQDEIFWTITDDETISWNVAAETRLPHSDNMEMSGQQVAGIIRYSVNEKRELSLVRHIIFPQLRVYINSSDSPWLKYRAYLKRDYGDDLLPVIVRGDRRFEPGPLDSVTINGMLNFYHAPREGLAIKRTLLPSTKMRLFSEIWEITNHTDSLVRLETGNTRFEQNQEGIYGNYKRIVCSDSKAAVTIKPGESYVFTIHFMACLNDEPEIRVSASEIVSERAAFLDSIQHQLILETPDPVLNNLFYFSKIRAAESIYSTPMGLVHSPGGGRYYTGVWANDQAEYSGPFFPYLGYGTGNIAALNAYRVFLKNIPEGDSHFWSSFEMNGELTCCGADRGDAAMIAFGAAHYALATGSESIANELWPLIEWCLGYCERQKNSEGVILSETDEMEGRIETGRANLSTSSLYYGALLLAADLAAEIKIPEEQVTGYQQKAVAMAGSIEQYFGANIEGLETYRYFNGHPFLRHWICLPLVMGINDRKDGTLEALFTKLWTDNGVRVEYNPGLDEPELFWDRGTLYAFRGAFKAGAADRATEKLQAYSRTRLLGFHVPYVVEAWPEGNMAHLSAESALYCRIFTEGLAGINPTGLSEFEITPQLPSGWDHYKIRNIGAFGRDFDISVSRESGAIRLKVNQGNQNLMDKKIKNGEKVRIRLK